MKLSKPIKLLLAIITCLPIVYFIFFMGFMMISFATFSNPSSGKSMLELFDVIFVLHFAIILLSFALIAFYMVYLFKTDRVTSDKKALWAVVLFLGSFFAMPIFWYLYIWREPSRSTASEQVTAADAASGPR